MKQQHVLTVLLLLLFNFSCLLSQEKLISGEASILANSRDKTKAQYEYETLELAREIALDKEYGTSVVSNYERLILTEMRGRSVEYNSDMRNNYLNTFPNGVWVKDESKNCSEPKDENGNFWYTCKVTGYARKSESARVQFSAYTLDGTDPVLNRSESFVDKEKGYLYFRSPEDGYAVVFFDDMKTVQRCIPYNSNNENSLKVENNKEYIFFSKDKCDYLPDNKMVNRLEFFTELPMDYNQFYILFSPTPVGGYFLDPSRSLENNYKTFKSMERENFHSWLQEQRIRNKALQVQIIGVTITRSK